LLSNEEDVWTEVNQDNQRVVSQLETNVQDTQLKLI
jgi:hypothetical protein